MSFYPPCHRLVSLHSSYLICSGAAATLESSIFIMQLDTYIGTTQNLSESAIFELFLRLLVRRRHLDVLSRFYSTFFSSAGSFFLPLLSRLFFWCPLHSAPKPTRENGGGADRRTGEEEEEEEEERMKWESARGSQQNGEMG